MSRKEDGGEAYPRTQWTGDVRNKSFRDIPGMSLRDYFAGQAMSLLILNGKAMCNEVAIDCYNIADAMIKERMK